MRLPAGVTVHRSSIVLQQIAADATLTCSIGADGGIMAGGINYGKEPLRFTSGGGPIGWGTRQYRGTLVVSVASRGLILVNEVGLEDYLRGVVPAEVNPTWQIEALKAQAIAARTFTVGRIGHHRKDGYDLCATVDCQVYVGAGGEKPSTDLAVAETAGRVLTYSGRLANTFYHAASGGHTENVESVWTGASPQAYLRGVPDPAESSPYDRWRVELDWAGAEAAVALKYPEIGRLRAIEIVGRTAAGRDPSGGVGRRACQGQNQRRGPARYLFVKEFTMRHRGRVRAGAQPPLGGSGRRARRACCSTQCGISLVRNRRSPLGPGPGQAML